VAEGTRIWRVWGDAAASDGSSWTTVDPSIVSDFRSAAGLPTQNTGRFVSEGILTDTTGVTSRSSLALGGNPGGLPEIVIPDPAIQVKLTSVGGVNPRF